MAGTAPPTLAGWSNWAGNQRATATAILRPTSLADVADAVRAAATTGDRIRAVGSGHSFTGVAVTDGRRMELADLDTGVRVDVDRRLVTVPAGTTLRALNDLLAAHGLALPNLGDIDAQTIAGAISTGTHGTGAGYGCLSTFVE
ncbi:FAD-binding protein, partial [Nonomuraea sp. NPDC049141]